MRPPARLPALIGVVLLTLCLAASGATGIGVFALAAPSAGSSGVAAAADPAKPASAAKGDRTGASKGSPGKHAKATPVPPAVAAKVAQAPTDVFVMFDASAGLAKIRSATKGGLSQSNRSAASAAAAAAYAATKKSALATVSTAGLHLQRDYSHLPLQLIRVDSPQALAALAAAPGVSALSLPRILRTQSVPADLSLIHQPQAAVAGATGAGTSVAVIDTGVDYLRAGASAYFGNCAAGPGTGTCRIDRLVDQAQSGQLDVDPGRHGTNVSGIIAETAPSAHLTVYGVFKIMAGGLGATDADILAALDNVIATGAATNIRSVNMSLGYGEVLQGECADSAYTDAFLSLRALGIVPTVAAGNFAESTGAFRQGLDYPACTPGAVRVGATYAVPSGSHFWDCQETGSVDKVACFSESSPLLSVLAPGVDITAVGITESGTSQATPHVAAAIADMFSLRPQATAQQVVQAITSTGKAITDPRDNVTTNRLDIAEAADAMVATTSAEVTDASCSANPIAANDDDSSPAVALPTPLDFYGTTYSSLYVNNNGNVTFQAPQGTYTPFTIDASTPPIIAPFFADVDTRGPGSGLVSYGTTTFGSRTAFCVNWNNVGYFQRRTDKLNSFQLLLVDRGDVGPGDFDIVMNFNTLNWETGDASGGSSGFGGTAAGAGFSAGDNDPSHFFQFPGSLTSLALLDTSPSTALVNNSRLSLQPGRYIFPIRNGAAPGAGEITGTVADNHGAPQLGAPVQACPEAGGDCVTGLSGVNGKYTIVGVAPGAYDLTAYPPPGASLRPGHAGPVAVPSNGVVQANLVLSGPHAPPVGTTITNIGTTGDGVPIVYWTAPLTLETNACTGGSGSYTVTLAGAVIRSGAMVETPPGSGHYEAAVDPFYPDHGDASVAITVTCPSGPPATRNFDIYIDPTGTVLDQDGNPLADATVTLLRSDTSTGPFVPVPNGSAIMSPSGRDNPEITGPDGVFHWDVLAGFYQVRASRPGCHAVGSSATSVTSAVFAIPPPALGIQLTLQCGAAVPVGLRASTTNAIAGQHVTLTATAGTSVGPAGLEILIRDRSADNAVVTVCTTGTVCTASVLNSGQHQYVAEVVDLAHRVTLATSTVVTVTWPYA